MQVTQDDMRKSKFHDVQQNTDEWQALRLGKATASNFACFMANYGKAFGDPAKRYALQIALERLTGKKAEFSFSNEHMERGHEQEPVAKMLYAEETLREVLNGGFFDCGEYGDSPDGLVGEHGVVEVKSVIAPDALRHPAARLLSIRPTSGSLWGTWIALAEIGWTSSATARTSPELAWPAAA
jgi:hypothetical protein